MGLTIHYSLAIPPRPVEDVRQLVGQLRQRALDLPFKWVSDVIELSGDACDFDKAEPDAAPTWLLVQAGRYVERDDCYFTVPPTRLVAFCTDPADGSESANFGLCEYPATATDPRGQEFKTGFAPGWHWASFCKTQYASNPADGDVENFLRAHLTIVRLLDHARELGLLKDVEDEGGYWKNRDEKALAEEVGRWNALIAAFVGGLKDRLGGERLESQITKYPNFEHLEAEGRGPDESAGPGDGS